MDRPVARARMALANQRALELLLAATKHHAGADEYLDARIPECVPCHRALNFELADFASAVIEVREGSNESAIEMLQGHLSILRNTVEEDSTPPDESEDGVERKWWRRRG